MTDWNKVKEDLKQEKFSELLMIVIREHADNDSGAVLLCSYAKAELDRRWEILVNHTHPAPTEWRA